MRRFGGTSRRWGAPAAAALRSASRRLSRFGGADAARAFCQAANSRDANADDGSRRWPPDSAVSGDSTRHSGIFFIALPATCGEKRSGKSGAAEAGVRLRLHYRPPYDWEAMVSYLQARAIQGVEVVENGIYRRTVEVDGITGAIEVAHLPREQTLHVAIHFPNVRSLPAIVSRVRRLFDLDADIETINAHLSRDPLLASLVGRRPGLRAPGGWDGFELGVRAILGQQISVAAARRLAGELVARHGQAVSKDLRVPRKPLARISHGGTSRQGRIDWPAHSAGAPTGLEGFGGGRGKRSGLVSPVWKHRNIPHEIAYHPGSGRVDSAIHRAARPARNGRIPLVGYRIDSRRREGRRDTIETGKSSESRRIVATVARVCRAASLGQRRCLRCQWGGFPWVMCRGYCSIESIRRSARC